MKDGMNQKICDICYHQSGRKILVESKYRSRWKKPPQVIILDVCTQHKDYLKGFKNFEEAQKSVSKLHFG